MDLREEILHGVDEAVNKQKHAGDCFILIKQIIAAEAFSAAEKSSLMGRLYARIREQIVGNESKPATPVAFGTSGWRGILGTDLFCRSVAQVTLAIVKMYERLENDDRLAPLLGVHTLDEGKKRGCVVGHDNRFCGDILARTAVRVLDHEGFVVHFAGESTTGVLSAAVLQLDAAFSINFTPSHNPLEYGGLKYNAADGGPAAPELTRFITETANDIIETGSLPENYGAAESGGEDLGLPGTVSHVDSFALWCRQVEENEHCHGLQYDRIIEGFLSRQDMVVAVDSVHGASRLHIRRFFKDHDSARILQLRETADVTFGGVAPEPSSRNMESVVSLLRSRGEKYRIGAIIDPDADRIRFTDGRKEISMNQFGAMAYHYLHEFKGKRGMVGKTVATSNFANSIAAKLGEKVFEPPVGFKEFKPVIGKALVYFEESDGISIIGHTPEKDAYIGLLLALAMVQDTGKNLSEYLDDLEGEYGEFYPDRDGIEVSVSGAELRNRLEKLEKYTVGTAVSVGTAQKTIKDVLDIDGRKMIFEDDSWLMIRPSGTEPKVRFYIESRSPSGAAELVDAAKKMLAEIGLVSFSG